MNHLLIGGIGGVVTVVILVSLMASHAKALFRQVQNEWEKLRDLLSLRADYLPNFIETIREKTQGQEAVIQQVIDAREAAEHVHVAGLDKFETEMRLSQTVQEMKGLVKEFPELGTDTNFLELKSDLKEVRRSIELQTLNYNEAVRRHNKFAKFVPFQSRVQIFEFE